MKAQDFFNEFGLTFHNESKNILLKVKSFDFNKLPIEMKWGVYISFFDKFGFHPYTEKYKNGKYDYTIVNDHIEENNEFEDDGSPYDTIEEAMNKAIEKCFELLNEHFEKPD